MCVLMNRSFWESKLRWGLYLDTLTALCSGNTVLCVCVRARAPITGNLKVGETAGYPDAVLHTSPLTLNIPRGVLRGPPLVCYWLTYVEINKHKIFDTNNA